MRKAIGALLLLVTAAVLAGCSSGERAMDGTAAVMKCPPGPPYSERWVDEMAGGPADGPVVLAIGREGMEGIGTTWDPGREVLFAKVLIGVAAPAGTPIRLEARMLGSGAPISLTHLGSGRQSAEGVLVARLPERGQEPGGLADLPGYVRTAAPGCAELRARVGGRSAGPFYLRLVAPV